MALKNLLAVTSAALLVINIGLAGEMKGLGAIDTGVVEELPFKATVSVRGGYDSNPLTRSGEALRFSDTGQVVRNPETGEPLFVDEVEESWFTTAYLIFSKEFRTTRSLLNLAFTAGITQYWDLSQDEWDPLLKLELDYRYALSPKLELTANAYVSYQSEPDFFNENNATLNGRRNGNYFYSNARLSASYRWTPKFSTVTSYNFVAVNYEETAVGNVEDRYENIFSQEFRYLILPNTTLTAQYRFNYTTYDSNTGRDTTNHIVAAGLSQQFTPRLSASFRAGAQFQNSDDGTERTSPYGEGTVSYAYSPDSQLSMFLRYGLENSSRLTADTSNETFRIGMRVNHRFTGKLLGNANVYYQNSEISNDPFSRTEDTFNAGVGLTYFLTNNFFVDANYTFSMIDSDQLFSSYDRHRASIGLGAEF